MNARTIEITIIADTSALERALADASALAALRCLWRAGHRFHDRIEVIVQGHRFELEVSTMTSVRLMRAAAIQKAAGLKWREYDRYEIRDADGRLLHDDDAAGTVALAPRPLYVDLKPGVGA